MASQKSSVDAATQICAGSSEPMTRAIITSWPDYYWRSASARIPGKIGAEDAVPERDGQLRRSCPAILDMPNLATLL
jgi:hypothetical protein